jgi:cytoskeletal protein CcmA (bactofilin family)
MPPVNAVRKREPAAASAPETRAKVTDTASEAMAQALPPGAGAEEPKLRSIEPAEPANQTRGHSLQFQQRAPVIVGEASFRGWLPVDGVISGQMSASGAALTVRQRRQTGITEPELNGEIYFREMLRVNGFVAGRIFSEKGTLIVAVDARVDADIEAGIVSIGGTVNGNVTGYERVELGPAATITGNISAGSLEIKPGAIFQGGCGMLTNKSGNR